MTINVDGLLAEVQEQIDELKPMLGGDQPDPYTHGWRNGAFYAWVEMRRYLKELQKENEEARITQK